MDGRIKETESEISHILRRKIVVNVSKNDIRKCITAISNEMDKKKLKMEIVKQKKKIKYIQSKLQMNKNGKLGFGKKKSKKDKSNSIGENMNDFLVKQEASDIEIIDISGEDCIASSSSSYSMNLGKQPISPNEGVLDDNKFGESETYRLDYAIRMGGKYTAEEKRIVEDYIELLMHVLKTNGGMPNILKVIKNFLLLMKNGKVGIFELGVKNKSYYRVNEIGKITDEDEKDISEFTKYFDKPFLNEEVNHLPKVFSTIQQVAQLAISKRLRSLIISAFPPIDEA